MFDYSVLIHAGLILFGLVLAYCGRKMRRSINRDRVLLYLWELSEPTKDEKKHKRIALMDDLASTLIVIGGVFVGIGLIRMVL